MTWTWVSGHAKIFVHEVGNAKTHLYGLCASAASVTPCHLDFYARTGRIDDALYWARDGHGAVPAATIWHPPDSSSSDSHGEPQDYMSNGSSAEDSPRITTPSAPHPRWGPAVPISFPPRPQAPLHAAPLQDTPADLGLSLQVVSATTPTKGCRDGECKTA